MMWNTTNTLSLIEDLRNNPCLWDTSSTEYKLRDKKYEVFEELGKKYSVNPSEVEKKIQSLKSQFRREQRKINETEKNVKVKCNWFGYAPLMFLRNGLDEGNEKCVYGVSIKSDMLYNCVGPEESADITEIDYINYSMDSHSQSAIIDKSVVKEESNELGNKTLECMKTLIDVVTKRDAFSTYGDYIAEKLRSSERSKMEIHIAQHHIDNVVFNLIMGVYGRGAVASGSAGAMNTNTASGSAGAMNTNTAFGIPDVTIKEEKM